MNDIVEGNIAELDGICSGANGIDKCDVCGAAIMELFLTLAAIAAAAAAVDKASLAIICVAEEKSVDF
jgi:hypothetical protein